MAKLSSFSWQPQMWTHSWIFSNTWEKCNYPDLDFTRQTEMRFLQHSLSGRIKLWILKSIFKKLHIHPVYTGSLIMLNVNRKLIAKTYTNMAIMTKSFKMINPLHWYGFKGMDQCSNNTANVFATVIRYCRAEDSELVDTFLKCSRKGLHKQAICSALWDFVQY